MLVIFGLFLLLMRSQRAMGGSGWGSRKNDDDGATPESPVIAESSPPPEATGDIVLGGAVVDAVGVVQTPLVTTMPVMPETNAFMWGNGQEYGQISVDSTGVLGATGGRVAAT